MPPNTDFAWPFAHVTGTGLVKTGPGCLHSIVLNGVTVVGDVTIYDGVDNTGVVVAVMSVRTAVSVSYQPVNFVYDAKLETGIYIEYSQGAGVDLTVMHD